MLHRRGQTPSAGPYIVTTIQHSGTHSHPQRPVHPIPLYESDSTANLAPLPQNGPNRQYCFAGSSNRAPRILNFSIVVGADYSFYVKFIAT